MEMTSQAPRPYYQRFDAFDRVLHGVLMFAFLGLAFTGLPLFFSDARWAAYLSAVFGGPHAATIFHRVFAALLIGCFVTHVMRLLHRLFVRKDLDILWGPASMTPQPRDVREMLAHLRYFVGLGPRPRFDHFTYWQKFDYWAVFWGMGIIGTSGLVLWFPEFFSRFLPGSWFNVALVVHGEEGLLAVGFIFTVHFFNEHLRPEKFPMDPVIFTGRLTHHELEEEHPAEYERLARERRLEAHGVGEGPVWLPTLAKAVAVVAVTLGLLMVGLIIFAVLSSSAH